MKIKNITPELVTENIEKTLKFYTEVLNLELAKKVPDINPFWIKLKSGNDYIMFITKDSLGTVIPEINNISIGGSFNIYFEIEDIEEYYENIKDQLIIIKSFQNSPYKHFVAKDPNGYILLFGQH